LPAYELACVRKRPSTAPLARVAVRISVHASHSICSTRSVRSRRDVEIRRLCAEVTPCSTHVRLMTSRGAKPSEYDSIRSESILKTARPVTWVASCSAFVRRLCSDGAENRTDYLRPECNMELPWCTVCSMSSKTFGERGREREGGGAEVREGERERGERKN
jgi:hypothetical protein